MSSVAELRLATRRLINEADATNSHFTDPELLTYLNQAVTFLGTQLEWPEGVDQATAVPGTALYQLPDDFIELTEVYFNGAELSILERADMGHVNSIWQQDQPGMPQIAYRYNRNTVGLYPVPDDKQTGYTLEIQYIYMPASLSLDTDVPDIHTAFQMCLPFYAAFLCESKLGNDKRAETNLTNFDRHRKAFLSKVQKYSDDLLRFRWAWGVRERNQ
jgi:hypothetical protein